MTSPGDRPAAELLAEWRLLLNGDGPDLTPNEWRRYNMGAVLARLARAEQALAEAKADAWDRGYFAQCHCGCLEARETVNPYGAALRASQGGQDG